MTTGIRKNDTVVVTTGREKGKTGKVSAILTGSYRAIVDGLGKVKRHQKPTAKLRQGGIIEKESSIHLSNLLVFCGRCQKGARIRQKEDSKGVSSRACHRCGEVLGA